MLTALRPYRRLVALLAGLLLLVMSPKVPDDVDLSCKKSFSTR